MAEAETAGLTGALLTVAEVAGLLRVSNMTVYRLINAGDLSSLRVGKNYRIRESDLESFLRTGTRPGNGTRPVDESNG